MAQKFLSIKNFEKYQTSTKHGRPWIKLWKSILTDPEFMKLSVHDRYLYMGLLIIADDCNNRIPNDHEYLVQRLYIPCTGSVQNVYEQRTEGVRNAYKGRTVLDLKALYRSGFLATTNPRRALLELEKNREELEESRGADAPPSPPVVSLPPKEKKRPQPLPADFKFTPELREWALIKGCKEPFAEFERFCSKAVSKGWVYVDWPQAYQNWVLNELKWAREKANAAV